MGNRIVSYSAMKGRAAKTPAAIANQVPLEELSEAAKERIEANKNFVIEHMPDMLTFMRDLLATNQIEGWRNIKQTRLLDEAENE